MLCRKCSLLPRWRLLQVINRQAIKPQERIMLKTRTIWNKLLSATAAFVLAFAIAPQQNCCCAQAALMQNTTESAEAAEAAHSCCSESSETDSDCHSSKNDSIGNDSLSGNCEFQEDPCACSFAKAPAYLAGRNPELNPENAVAFSKSRMLAELTEGSENEEINIRQLELENDELKSEKIYLLNCSLLN